MFSSAMLHGTSPSTQDWAGRGFMLVVKQEASPLVLLMATLPGGLFPMLVLMSSWKAFGLVGV